MHFQIYEDSRIVYRGTTYLLAKEFGSDTRYLGTSDNIQGFNDLYCQDNGFLFYPISQSNTDLICQLLPWLKPKPLGIQSTMGFGDRLGLATPGHVAAVRGTRVLPIFAQQSVRENLRTKRSPQQVLNDALWGLFQEGWQGPWGADADHIKNINDIDEFINAGYSFYTLDLSDQLVEVRSFSTAKLKKSISLLPWDKLLSSPETMFQRYADSKIKIEGSVINFDQLSLLRGIVKYGRAIAHVARIYQYLTQSIGHNSFDLEISLDETEDPTSIQDHYFIASELSRLGVRWQSLALRFCGEFFKGIDYVGDLRALDSDLCRHAAIMRSFGTYKLSLHSGSDKFSVYPILSAHTGGQYHVKTAGTSYLEALRIVAKHDPRLFSNILDLALSRFLQDRVSYRLNARLENVPDSHSLSETDLPSLLDDDHARQVLHVTYGSVISQFGKQLKYVLSVHEQEYKTCLEDHFHRHLLSLSV